MGHLAAAGHDAVNDSVRRARFPVPLDRVARPVTPAPRPVHDPSRGGSLPGVGFTRPVAAAAGMGLDSALVRDRMLQRLSVAGIRNAQVLRAMGQVPRHCFVDTALVAQAYEDTSLPIGLGQTISKPSVVARMIELLLEGVSARRQGALGNVLEIGTGCGYQAAVLMHLARQVMSVERLKPLYERARGNLAELRQHHVRLIYGDGRHGHPPNAPYDSVIAAAGGDELPSAWLEQLAVGGRLVAPRADSRSGAQVLVTVDRTPDGYVHALHESVMFVPLKSGLA